MRTFPIEINEKYFNLLWRALSAHEANLLERVKGLDADSDEAAMTGNDVVYLRLCKKEMEEKAKANGFSSGAFSLDDGQMDLSKL
jgi:hypothetical protein